MKLRAKLNLPREHGAWAMFYVPFLLGLLVAGTFNFAAALLLIAASALFISRESLLIYWRARLRGRRADQAWRLLVIYFTLAAGCGIVLLWRYRLFLLPVLAVPGFLLLLINGRQATQREERTIRGELMAICGLTLSAPAAYYVARGQWDDLGWWLWAFCALFFASSVFYVKLRVTSLHAKNPSDRQRARVSCLAYHALLLAALVLLVAGTAWPVWSLIAFLPAILRAFYPLFRPVTELNLKQVGLLEIVYALLFLIFAMISFAGAPAASA